MKLEDGGTKKVQQNVTIIFAYEPDNCIFECASQ